MKGHANWSGRTPRTLEQAFGPGEYMKTVERRNPDAGCYVILAICLAIMVGLMFGWPV